MIKGLRAPLAADARTTRIFPVQATTPTATQPPDERERQVERKIDSLVHYLWSIQEE